MSVIQENENEKEFNITSMGVTMGTLICSYLYNDERVFNAGYQKTRDGNLVIKVQTVEGSPVNAMDDAIAKCKDDLNTLLAGIPN